MSKLLEYMKNFYILLILLLSINTAKAQWQQTNGPYGGTITCIAISENNIFAGTSEGGMYLSADNGGSWTAVNNGLTNYNIMSLAAGGSNIFAGTQGGVFLSTDNGNSWKAVNNGLPTSNNHVLSLTINGSNIFAGTVRDGVFLSTNNGSSWTAVNSGLTNKTIWSLANSGNNIFAGTETAGVFLSTNNGSSWTQINKGLSPEAFNVKAFAIDGNNIYMGGGHGIYLSTNNGSSWTESSIGLSDYGMFINSFVISGSNIFVGTNDGVFLSTNNGGSWSSVKNGFIYPLTCVFALAINGSNIFAGTQGTGMFLSSNNGNSWDAVNTGIIKSSIPALAINGSNIFASNYNNGVFLSSNNGNSWIAVNNGFSNFDVASFTISGDNIFAGAGCGGVFLSTDNGSNWATVNTGLTSLCIYSFAVRGSNIFVGTQGGVFMSANNGNSWTSVSPGLPSETRNIKLAISGSSIFAGTEKGMYLSTNNGNSWTTVNAGLKNLKISTLAINGGNIFAGTPGDGVYLSTNNGSSWTSVNTGLTNLEIRSFARSGSNMYVGTNGGVFLSTNNGSNWNALNNGLTSPTVRSLAIGGGFIFAGTYDGVWKLLLTEEPKFVLSGRVTDQIGNAIIGAVMKGLPGNPMTDNNGNFEDSVSQGWSGNVTPSLNGYSFSPVNRIYEKITANAGNQDFKGNFVSIRSIIVTPESFIIHQTAVSSVNSLSYGFLDNKANNPMDSALQELSLITNHSMGCLIPDSIVEYWRNHEPVLVLNLKSISTIIDWSDNDSPIKDQGGCGACWAFAAVAYIENLGTQNDLSEQTLLSCSESGGCQGGFYEQAMKFIQSKGISDETCYPYTQQNGNCSNMCSNPSYKEKIMTVSNILWGIATVDQLKAQLQNGPLVVAMKIPFDNTFDGVPGYQGGVYHYSGGLIPETRGHAILLVGYDDNQKCFKAKNSWGNGWGENGYFRISYDDLTNEVQFGSYAINGVEVYSENLSNSSFTISNQGNDNLTIASIQSDKDWLTISGYPGGTFLVSPETSQNVSVVVNWSKLGPIKEIGTITIESNDPDKPSVTIQVTAIPLCSSIVTATITHDGNTTICEGDYVVLNANTGDDLIYQWEKNGIVIPDANGTSYIATTGGAYNVEVTHVGTMCSSVSSAIALVVNPTPPQSTVTLNGITLKSNHTTDNQWYNENGLITGATTQSYAPTKSGVYYVVTNINGCNSNPSNTINFITTGIDSPTFNKSIGIGA